MDRLVNPQTTISIIQKYDFVFRKRYGQNFLVDAHVLDRIIAASGVTREDYVLEIGPGIGTMTQALAEAARGVTAVEIDENLIPILEETLADYENVELVNADILKVDVKALAREKSGDRPIHVVANLPYYITTPILMSLFESGVPLKNVTVMVQKEVAERMKAVPGTKDYGALTLAVQYYAEPYLAANVPPNCFLPRPSVGSAVVRLARYEAPPVDVADPEKMFGLIHASFRQRRKTLANSVANAAELSYTREAVAEAVAALGLPATVRGEALSLAQFAALSNLLP